MEDSYYSIKKIEDRTLYCSAVLRHCCRLSTSSSSVAALQRCSVAALQRYSVTALQRILVHRLQSSHAMRDSHRTSFVVFVTRELVNTDRCIAPIPEFSVHGPPQVSASLLFGLYESLLYGMQVHRRCSLFIDNATKSHILYAYRSISSRPHCISPHCSQRSGLLGMQSAVIARGILSAYLLSACLSVRHVPVLCSDE